MAESYARVQRKLAKLHGELSWSHMSRETGISATTIKNFAHNLTRRPQYRTVELLSDYVGFRLAISDLRINTVIRLRRKQ